MLESSAVLPLLMAAILLFILFGAYVYQKTLLNYAASVTSERAAFAWDNSHRDPRSGILHEARYDGLYRRLGSDGVLAALIGAGVNEEKTAIELDGRLAGGGEPSEDDDSDSAAGFKGASLARIKLMRAGGWLSEEEYGYAGQVSYAANGIHRYVKTRLRQPMELPVRLGGVKRQPAAISSGMIVDPVEFIRTVDLARYYASKFGGQLDGGEESKRKAGEVLASYE